MICPALSHANTYSYETTDGQSTTTDLQEAECIGERCAWWIPDADMCAMKALGMETAATKLSIEKNIAQYEEII